MRLRDLGGRYGDMVNTALKKLGSLSRKANPGSFPIRTDMGVRRSRAPRCGKVIFTRTASDMDKGRKRGHGMVRSLKMKEI